MTVWVWAKEMKRTGCNTKTALKLPGRAYAVFRHMILQTKTCFVTLFILQAEDDNPSSGDLDEEGMKTLQQQEEMFRNLDVQYEMARSQTHTQRGMGLGFSTSFSSRGMDPV